MTQAPLVTIVETAAYLAEARKAMTEEERRGVVDLIAADPTCGDLIVGGGGIRKVRYAIGHRGKSGGVRVIYYFHSEAYPAFLLTLFAKNERANLSTGEVNELGQLAKLLCRKYGAER